MNTYWVYILKCNDDSYYTGVTNDLERRIEEHNYGIDKNSYTYYRKPLKLVYSEETNDISQAISREKQIKKWSRIKKESLIKKDFDILQSLSKNYKNASAGSAGQHGV